MSIKSDLEDNIQLLSRDRQYKLLCVLQEISQLMVDEAGSRFNGAHLSKEYKTKNITI